MRSMRSNTGSITVRNDMEENKIVIRKMMPEDLPVVDVLERECFSLPWSIDCFESALENPNQVFIVLLEDEKIVGYAGMWCVVDEGQIMNIAVTKTSRRKGYGAKLLESLIDEGKERGMTVFSLEVRVGNFPARSLYESFGFKQVGLRKGYYDEPKEDALLMDLSV